MKKLLSLIIAFSIINVISTNNTYAQKKGNENIVVENNIDRPGKDYKRIELAAPNVDLCIELCLKDPKCKAFTYVKPRVQGPKAVCYLKNEFPNPVKNTNCISGIKQKIKLIKGTKIEAKPAEKENQVSSLPIPLPDPNEQVGAIPINLPFPRPPRPDLVKTRAEVLQEAFDIPDLNRQLIEITNSKGMYLSNLINKTSDGKPAKSIIGEGQKKLNVTTMDQKDEKLMPSDFDWSGGIQLTPVEPFSNLSWQNNDDEYVPVAYMVISGITTYVDNLHNQHYHLKDMFDNNSVFIGYLQKGKIEVILYLPDEYINPYLVTVHVSNGYSTTIPYKAEYSNSQGTLQLNSKKDKYIGLLNLKPYHKNSNERLTIDLEGKFMFFNGITITQL